MTDSIGSMFSALAGRYRIFNFLSSLGLDRFWRRELVSQLGPVRRVLDVGTGTGDLAREILIRNPGATVVGMDLSFEMIAEGKRAFACFPPTVQASADRLPFLNGIFESVVSAFVLRNLFLGGVLAQALRDISRVLEPGGKLVFMDLTRPDHFLVRWGHGFYGRTVVPFWGWLLFGKDWPGAYLNNSIRALPPPHELKELFLSNGFTEFQHRPLWGGIVSLFIGKK